MKGMDVKLEMDLQKINNNKSPFSIICSIAREKNIKKLKSFLDSWIKEEIVTYHLMPFEEHILLEIVSPSCEKINKLMCFISVVAPQEHLSYKISSQDEIIFKMDNGSPLSSLPTELLTEIFRKCALKEQIALTKTCRKFYFLIKDIWRFKYRSLNYSFRFQIEEGLSDHELEDFFIIHGNNVDSLTFMAYIEDGVFSDLQIEEGNPMTANREALNNHLSNNLIFFPNLESFYNNGPLLMENICVSLAQFCKKLTTFKVVDNGNRLLTGENFFCMSKLEKLSLRGAQNLNFNNLSVLCRMVRLKSLNLTKCEPNLNARLIDRLCENLLDLETFKLSALHGEDMLASIMQLPQLKRLQFNCFKLSFLSLLFRKIDAYRTLDLYSLKFSYTKWLLSRKLSSEKKKCLKVMAARKIAPKTVIPEDIFEELLDFLRHFYYLKEMIFEYNLVFNASQLERIILELPNINKIIFKECHLTEHESIIDLMGKPVIMDKCSFMVEDVDSYILMKHSIWIRAKSTLMLPPFNSIECFFQKNK